ncbi:hypothetical protein ES703_81030 [subsurface metagenome]
MPLNNPTASGAASEGTYAGDNTANRFIPHGLPGTPKAVIIVSGHAGDDFGDKLAIIKAGWERILYFAGGANSSLAVTAMDGTNFHVGNATSYELSQNLSGIDYYWITFP